MLDMQTNGFNVSCVHLGEGDLHSTRLYKYKNFSRVEKLIIKPKSQVY